MNCARACTRRQTSRSERIVFHVKRGWVAFAELTIGAFHVKQENGAFCPFHVKQAFPITRNRRS